DKIKRNIERDGESQVVDLHVWSIGPNIHAAIISVLTNQPKTSEDYKASLPEDLGLEHVSIEVKIVDKFMS
ncbi:MAG: hypothetical protein K0B14_15140, partial [Anaerolineaceae bacterium]|nr:hypothetical protein [Anaerolineaceae bacterium]